jgi:hypothetical protein
MNRLNRFTKKAIMANICTVCAHKSRNKINEALISGQSIRSVAAQYNLAVTSVRRHKTNHISQNLVKAKEAQVAAQADDLLGQVKNLLQEAKDITTDAKTLGDLKTALMGIGRIKDLLELLLKVSGELEQKTEVNILINPQFQAVQAVLLRELEPYPDIRCRIVDALSEVVE